MPLLLYRKVGESVVLHTPAGPITVKIVGQSGLRVAVGVNAPRDMAIQRDDVKKGPKKGTTKAASASAEQR